MTDDEQRALNKLDQNWALHGKFLIFRLWALYPDIKLTQTTVAYDVFPTSTANLNGWIKGDRNVSDDQLRKAAVFIGHKSGGSISIWDFESAFKYLRDSHTLGRLAEGPIPDLAESFLKLLELPTKAGEPLPNNSIIPDDSSEKRSRTSTKGSVQVEEPFITRRETAASSTGPTSTAPTTYRLHPTFPKIGALSGSHQYGREEFKQVKDYLLSGPLKSASLTAAVHGAGGYGKTAIAEELCLDEEIEKRFPGGIFWLQFSMQQHVDDGFQGHSGGGRAGRVFRSASDAIREMLEKQGYEPSITDPLNIDSIKRLLEYLPGDPLLIIADDIWDTTQSGWVTDLSSNASALITTRNKSLAQQLGHPFLVDRLTGKVSYNLLTDGMDGLTADLEARLRKIADGFRGWALLLKIANGKFKQQYQSSPENLGILLQEYEDFLAGEDVTDWDAIGTDAAAALEKRRRLVGYCIEAGLDALLDPVEKASLLSLGVFPDDTDVPFSVIADYWVELSKDILGATSVSAQKCRTRLQTFDGLSFFRTFELQSQTVRLHDEVLAYLRKRSASPDDLLPSDHKKLQLSLLASLKSHCSAGWETLPTDHRYGWKHVLHHLERVGAIETANNMRTNFTWTKAMLNAVGLVNVQQSYRSSRIDEQAALVGRAINVSASVLSKRPGALAHQLYGRLGHDIKGRLSDLLTDARSDQDFMPVPNRPHLEPVGNEILRIDVGSIVNSATFGHKRQSILTVSWDNTVRLWDADTGQPVGDQMKHDGKVKSAVFSDDGQIILTASDDRTARLWDADTGQPVGGLMKHDSSVNSAVFSSDGQSILTASDDRTAQLWDVDSGQPVGDPMEHAGQVRSAVFSQDGQSILTTSGDGTARLWDAHTGQPVCAPIQHDNGVGSAVFSNDGKSILTASYNGTVRLWHAHTGQPVGNPMEHASGVNSAVFSNDGQRILTASYDGTTRLWDADTGQPVGAHINHDGKVKSAVFSDDGQIILTILDDDTARLWNADTGQPVGGLMKHDSSVNSAVFSSDGQSILTASYDGTARLWDTNAHQSVSAPMHHDGGINSAVFSHDGQSILTASDDRTAQLWHADTGQPVGDPMEHADGVTCAVFSNDGHSILTASYDGIARLWDAHTGQPLRDLMQHVGKVRSAVFGYDGQSILTASDDGTARLWDADTGQAVSSPMQHDTGVRSAVISDDGQRILSISDRGYVWLWDVQSGRPVCDPIQLVYDTMQPGGWVISAVFSDDGQRCLTASDGSSARLWDAHTGQPLGDPMQHDGKVRSAVFSDDGQSILTASDDGTARLWDADNGQPVGHPMHHDGKVKSAVFNHDGQHILTASNHRAVCIWDRNDVQKPNVVDFDHLIMHIVSSPIENKILVAFRTGQIVVLSYQ